MNKNKSFARPSRVFTISVHFFPVLDKSATWKDHFSSFNENVNTQMRIEIFFPSFDTAPLNLSSRASFQKLHKLRWWRKRLTNLNLQFWATFWLPSLRSLSNRGGWQRQQRRSTAISSFLGEKKDSVRVTCTEEPFFTYDPIFIVYHENRSPSFCSMITRSQCVK